VPPRSCQHDQVLSDATAERVLAFIVEENARSQAEVTQGAVPFDSRFGGVNCRGMIGMFGQRQVKEGEEGMHAQTLVILSGSSLEW
jgi:hypothetical protein